MLGSRLVISIRKFRGFDVDDDDRFNRKAGDRQVQWVAGILPTTAKLSNIQRRAKVVVVTPSFCRSANGGPLTAAC